MQSNERVLVVASAKATAARAAQRIVAAGGEAIITSVAAARTIVGAFNRGIFAFDFPDGSGIVLAAQMMLDARMGQIEFFHPADESVVCDGHPTEVRATPGANYFEQDARSVA